MSNLKKALHLRKELEAYFEPSQITNEKCYIDKDWWYVKTLVDWAKEDKCPIFDLQLSSIDLGVMPWHCKTVLHFIQHIFDIEAVTFKYPVIVSPSGWVLNGWHRIVKGILQNKTHIKAVRILHMPASDGTDP